LHLKHAETLSHTALSIAHAAIHPCDVAIVFNAANAPLLPGLQLRGIPAAIHLDGLEWTRTKWKGAGSRYYQWAERLAVWRADALIADARGIQDYYQTRYGVQTTFIPYGAPIYDSNASDRLTALGLSPDSYHLVVARMEPENNVFMIVDAYIRSGARLPLVVVGSAPYAEQYASLVRATARGSENVKFVGSIWDQDLLNELYANARLYLHGHSVGGTNPSLLRAMGAGASVAAFDVVFNREVLGDTGVYFEHPTGLAEIIHDAETRPSEQHARGHAARHRAAGEYDWDAVADRYEDLCWELVERSPRARRAVARREQPSGSPASTEATDNLPQEVGQRHR
jgi:glycosyltransferase involved in cell wall biosynthesis